MNSISTFCSRTAPSLVLSRSYAFKSDLKIKWVRPVKIPSYKAEKSGDLKPKYEIDKTQIVYEFRNSKELETADEIVKKLFTLEFAPDYATHTVYKQELMGKVRRHGLDDSSLEVRIAKWTGIIRCCQEFMEQYPQNKKKKIFLQELIDQRKKHLKFLRMWDYKRFEWLLETLDIVYKPPPELFHWITRKESLQKLTDKYCDQVKSKKLEEYNLQLEYEKPAFLEEKINCLQFIRDEQKECGQEVTVSEEEINKVREQLEQLKKQNAERNKLVEE